MAFYRIPLNSGHLIEYFRINNPSRMRSLEDDFENKIHHKLPSGLLYESLPRPIYIVLSSFQWDERWRNRLHVPCRGCRDSQSGLWISASGLFHSRGILTTPRLSSSHPENVEVYGYCLVQRMSGLVVQRVLKATAWEYSAFVLKARRNMEVRRGLRIKFHEKYWKRSAESSTVPAAVSSGCYRVCSPVAPQ